MSSFDDILSEAIRGPIDRARAEAFCAESGVRMDDLYNQLALLVARRFDGGAMDFADADAVMNHVFSLMTQDASRFGDGFEFTEPAYQIFLAFDGGEFDRGDGSDPIEKYTRPEVNRLVALWSK